MAARLFHLVSLSDCYWMKDVEEAFTWEQASLFENPSKKAVTSAAPLSINRAFRTLGQRIHTPEFTAQGVTAKAQTREVEGLYLYKVGKKESLAGRVLGAFTLPHVDYMKAENNGLEKVADWNHIDRVYKGGEDYLFRR